MYNKEFKETIRKRKYQGDFEFEITKLNRRLLIQIKPNFKKVHMHPNYVKSPSCKLQIIILFFTGIMKIILKYEFDVPKYTMGQHSKI